MSTSSEFSTLQLRPHDVEVLTFHPSWEYPNRQGTGCNTISKQDTPNFLSFLTELRAHPIGKGLILTAAAPISPWTNADDTPADISQFAKQLDYIAVMNYDIWGSWSKYVGPNAPLNDTCVDPQYQGGSAVSAIQAWTKAGLPKDQLVLGVPAYGHSYSVKKSDALTPNGDIAPYPPFGPDQPKGDRSDDKPGTDVCGAQTGYAGVYNFWGLVEEKFLDDNGQPLQGIYYRYDDCSQTVRFHEMTMTANLKY